MAKLSDYNILIRENHVDSYGHINNATYLSLYEEARWEIITAHGFGFKDIHQKKQGPIILEVQIKFLKEILLREQIRIESEVLDYPSKVGRMRQRMIKANGDIANEAVFVFGLFDMSQRKLIEPSAEWRRAIGI